MNPQPQQPFHSADARIDRVLDALRAAEVPSGLEQRVAARLLATTSRRRSSNSFSRFLRSVLKEPRVLNQHLPARIFAVFASITLLLTLSLLPLHLRHKPRLIAQEQLQFLPVKPQTLPQTINLSEARATAHATTNNRHRREDAQPATDPTDPDAVALAETLAPSHPAPPMPLTPQERLLLSATRKGAPIQLAELDVAREPALHDFAEAHAKAGLQQFARGLLVSLAISESLESTPQNDAQPNPSPSSH